MKRPEVGYKHSSEHESLICTVCGCEVDAHLGCEYGCAAETEGKRRSTNTVVARWKTIHEFLGDKPYEEKEEV